MGEPRAAAGMMDHTDIRYLEAKRSVDERALSVRVRDRLLASLPDRPRVLEAGCGTGMTVSRLLQWGVDPRRYVGVDRDQGVIDFARSARLAALQYTGYDVTATDMGGRIGDFPFTFKIGDALTAFEEEGNADLLIAQGFMDLVPIQEAVSAFETALRPGGLAYFPITFDGGTVFQPSHPADETIERAYHDAIDADPKRESYAGRHLLDLLQRREGTLVAMGASDWIVRPQEGTYPADEQYFLDVILDFIAEALQSNERVEATDWLDTRRRQLADGELTYMAHQYDLLYCRS
jgi:SAM-dependent methyltransferase